VKKARYQARKKGQELAVKDTKKTAEDPKETKCQMLQRKSAENKAKEELALLELQRLKRMMDTKRATLERLMEERNDLKNHIMKVPIWADDHLARLSWTRQQFEALISDLEARVDQLTETVRMQERQLIDCAEGHPNANQLLLPRHLTQNVPELSRNDSDWEDSDTAPRQDCGSMDGAQGAYPGGGVSINTNHSNQRTDPFEGEDRSRRGMASMMASIDALTIALNTNQGATTEGQKVTFEAEEEELGVAFFGGMVVVPEDPSENEEEARVVKSHEEADELLRTEAGLLHQATLALQRARGELSPGNGSTYAGDSPPKGEGGGATQGSFVRHTPDGAHADGDYSPDELTTRPTQTKSTEELDSDTLQDDADHEYARTMADPFMREQITRAWRPLDNWPHEATLEKMTDEEVRRLGILNLEANMREVRENLANLEEMRRELDDHKSTETEVNQGVSEDDDDLDTFSDSVEKWELKDG
jgi:hypothetical protein